MLSAELKSYLPMKIARHLASLRAGSRAQIVFLVDWRLADSTETGSARIWVAQNSFSLCF